MNPSTGSERKLSGMEQLMHSLLKAAGFDPDILAKDVGSIVTALQSRLDEIDKNQLSIVATQQEISARLERIELALEISVESTNSNQPRRLTSS